MTTRYHDHFSQQAPEYARYRPVYPAALVEFLSSLTGGHGAAWDCGTGSGQAAELLAAAYAHIHATDPSAAQLAQARPHPRITYRIGREGESGLPDDSVDLVTAAQAAHWFDLPVFYREAERVLRPGGVIAVWCYSLPQVSPEIDRVVQRFAHERVGPHWPPGREYVDGQYASLPFPHHRLPVPPLAYAASLDRAEFLGYVSTWSAVMRCREAERMDPLDELARDLGTCWRNPELRHLVRWPLHVVVGRP
jgi:SAM-dependent methyltransferase